MRQEPYLGEDPTDFRARRAAAVEAEKQRLLELGKQADAMRWLMSDARGRMLMWQWLSFCGVFRTPFARRPEQTAFNCGQHNVGLMLNAEVMRYCPDLYQVMQSEAVHLSEQTGNTLPVHDD